MTTIIGTYPAVDGKYYVQHFRLDVEGSEGCWIEIEYIGFTNNPEFTEEALTPEIPELETPEQILPESDPYITADFVTVKPGEEFTITVRIGNNPGLWGCAFELPIDDAIFEFVSAEDLKTVKPEFEIPTMHTEEDIAFIECVKTGTPDRNHIDNILESMKLLDALYQSAEKKQELVL